MRHAGLLVNPNVAAIVDAARHVATQAHHAATQHTMLQRKHSMLQRKHTMLQRKHSMLQRKHTMLQRKHTMLQRKHSVVRHRAACRNSAAWIRPVFPSDCRGGRGPCAADERHRICKHECRQYDRVLY
jgi:hypothetical protein